MYRLSFFNRDDDDDLICPVYVSFYIGNPYCFFFVFLICLVYVSFCNGKSLKKTCEKRYFNMSSVRLLLQWEIRLKKLVKSKTLIC